jgi:hypothetical protein
VLLVAVCINNSRVESRIMLLGGYTRQGRCVVHG